MLNRLLFSFVEKANCHSVRVCRNPKILVNIVECATTPVLSDSFEIILTLTFLFRFKLTAVKFLIVKPA